MPACSLGCRVFTRPSSISGKPVWSATSVTGRLCSARSFAVPPVDRILILNRARPRANSARPLLSDTLISAVRMGIMRVGGERLDHRSHLYFQRLDLLSQSIAVDPEHLRGDGLISLGPVEHELEHRTLDVLEHHVVDGARLCPVEVLEVPLQRPADAVRDLVGLPHTAVSPGLRLELMAFAGGTRPDSCRQLHLIAQAQILAPELLEETIDRVELLLAGFKLIHVMPEACRTGEPLRVPGDVLARNLDPSFSAIERVELVQMREQHRVDLGNERGREFLAR